MMMNSMRIESQIYDTDEEDEQERLLSAIHGEAQDDSKDPKETTEEEEDLEKVYEKPKRKVNRPPPVTSDQLTKALTDIPIQFPRHLVTPNNRQSAAKYTSRLLELYHDILPTDLQRVEKLGSTASVKKFLMEQRHHVTRNPYLQTLLGPERAARLLQQLDEYENPAASRDTNNNNNDDDDDRDNDEEEEVEFSTTNQAPVARPPVQATVVNTYLKPTTTTTKPSTRPDDDDDEEEETQLEIAPKITHTNVSKNKRVLLDDDSDDEVQFEVTAKKPRVFDDDDSDDEREFDASHQSGAPQDEAAVDTSKPGASTDLDDTTDTIMDSTTSTNVPPADQDTAPSNPPSSRHQTPTKSTSSNSPTTETSNSTENSFLAQETPVMILNQQTDVDSPSAASDAPTVAASDLDTVGPTQLDTSSP